MTDDVGQTEDKRSQILKAAELEFQEHGFQTTSMDRISARAGASKRTVYKHFESKEKTVPGANPPALEPICRKS